MFSTPEDIIVRPPPLTRINTASLTSTSIYSHITPINPFWTLLIHGLNSAVVAFLHSTIYLEIRFCNVPGRSDLSGHFQESGSYFGDPDVLFSPGRGNEASRISWHRVLDSHRTNGSMKTLSWFNCRSVSTLGFRAEAQASLLRL